MAPVLSFTAEEAWDILLGTALKTHSAIGRVTIFTECFHVMPAISVSETLHQRWTRLREIRALVMRKLEDLRSAGSIGPSLQEEVDLKANGEDLTLLQSVAEQLSFIFIVSRVSVHAGAGELAIEINHSAHEKCERCWHWREDIGQDPAHPHICGRCVTSLNEAASS